MARRKKAEPVDYSRNPVRFLAEQILKTERGRDYQLPKHHAQALARAFTWERHDACERCTALDEPVCVGHLTFRLLLWGEPKKSGKTLLAALLLLWWALTHPGCEIIVIANDEEQAVGRVLKALNGLLRHNPHLDPEVRMLEKETRFTNGSVVIAMASEFRGIAGSNHQVYVVDEPWGITSENAERLVEELTPPPSEPDAFGLMVTTAGWSGESVFLEALYKRGLTGAVLDPDLPLYRTGELTMLWSHQARMPTQTKKYLEEQRSSLRESTYRRLWLNEWVSSESQFITPGLWDPNVDPEHCPMARDKRIVVHIGVDVAIKHDTCSVVGVTRQGEQVYLVRHAIWTPTPERPIDLEATVEMFIYQLAHDFTVAGILADPYQFHRSLKTIERNGLPVHEYPQTVRNLTKMGQSLLDILTARALVLYPDDVLRQQALNTTCIESPRGFRIAKEKASRKIDAIVALSMAVLGATEGEAITIHTEEDLREMEYQEAKLLRRMGFDHPVAPWGGFGNIVQDTETHRPSSSDWVEPDMSGYDGGLIDDRYLGP
jgi:phage terminase large subunit-like protein